MTKSGNVIGVIFDMDGTLTDSHDAHYESWKSTMEAHEIAYGPTDFIRDFGRRNPEIIEANWARAGREAPDAQSSELIADEKEASFREIITADFPAMPGARTMMRRLHEHGFRLAIGSSAPRENIELCNRALDIEDCLDAVVCGCDVTRGKPEPDGFLLAADRLGCRPKDCIVVEDAAAGIEAAHRAGMPAVGIVSTGHDAKDLASAERVIHDLKELTPELLSGLVKEQDL